MMRFLHLFLCLVLLISPHTSAAQSSTIDCGAPYTVAPGDTLSAISIKAYGKSAFTIIYDANRDAIGENPNAIRVGQKLIVPCRGAAPVQAEQASTTPNAPVTLTFNKASDPRFVINVGIIDPYLRLIETATEGRVTFVDLVEKNSNPMDQMALVTSGKVDATYVYNGYLADTHPLLQLPMIPLMGGSAQQTAVSLWNLHDKYLAQSGYFSQAHLLGFISAPAAHIWRDLSAPVTDNEGILAKNVYPVPYFEGLDTVGPKRVQEQNLALFGGKDADRADPMTFMMAHGAARGAGIWNENRGVTEVENGIYTPTFSVIISNEAWAKISKSDQDRITLVSGLALSERSAAWDDFDNKHRGIMLEGGLAVDYPDRELHRELEEIAQMRLGKWAAHASARGIQSEQAIAAYRANLAELRYLLIYR